jgi:hypothetical protein
LGGQFGQHLRQRLLALAPDRRTGRRRTLHLRRGDWRALIACRDGVPSRLICRINSSPGVL